MNSVASDNSYSIIEVAKLISDDIVYVPENIANRLSPDVIAKNEVFRLVCKKI